MSNSFVCLACYNCVCRPPEKEVALTTMKRHRGLANEKWKRYRLEPLPKGPTPNAEASERERLEHRRLFQVCKTRALDGNRCAVVSVNGSELQLEIGNYYPPIEHLMHVDGIELKIANTATEEGDVQIQICKITRLLLSLTHVGPKTQYLRRTPHPSHNINIFGLSTILRHHSNKCQMIWIA